MHTTAHHAHGHAPPPGLFSATRLASFTTCILVALASGTNYVFSAYAPQLGSRLGLTHTQLNVIGLSGNIGVYGSAPLWGRIVDTRGPRGLFIMGFFALLVGYLGIRHYYDRGLPDGSSTLSTLSICLLAAFSFLTGIGGNGGLAGAMNSTAKSWPDRMRGSMNGVVISGFGLSAFLFSTIAHVAFPGNTSDFLLILAVGTALPMVLGFLVVRAIPLPHATAGIEEEAFEPSSAHAHAPRPAPSVAIASPALFRDDTSRTHLLSSYHHYHDETEDGDAAEEADELIPGYTSHGAVASDYFVPANTESVALSPTRSQGRSRSRSAFSGRRGSARSYATPVVGLEPPNVHGKGLFLDIDFWVMFSITALLAGTGLMYINNVGSISQALFATGNPDYDESKAGQWQATQVSIVSVTNCAGRFFVGMVADFVRNYLQRPRSFCITVVAAIFIVSQVTCYYVSTVENLWRASALLGLAYGCMFGLFPTICIEWFGLPHFSENWGFVSLAPMLGSNIFSLAFGRNLDAHAPHAPESSSAASSSPSPRGILDLARRAGLPGATQCLEGRACYRDSLKVTIAACFVALGLAMYSGWRDRRKQVRVALRVEGPGAEVVWEEEEE
ncbi:major facilitator superfamily domain-containing protein [Fomitopsis serialis]|uniref:major facilitator superfamily domain-containing protein n=1 Tax=Fomitopsis serialis TaxID=139415 RepID=UPI00200782B7|nr:major facilitator superfamily domain-containing protein [Neoantrodia serialis]KAH9928843.1 major facilitator superfamily domain-containing protein [Neoantrodia serialis]